MFSHYFRGSRLRDTLVVLRNPFLSTSIILLLVKYVPLIPPSDLCSLAAQWLSLNLIFFLDFLHILALARHSLGTHYPCVILVASTISHGIEQKVHMASKESGGPKGS